MTVFIAHAEADRAAAEALEKFLERRGLFVELESGVRGFRHVQPVDTVVALWSKNTVFSPQRLLLEKRTMEAWADEQLVLVKLDQSFAPVGLRDLPAIDASFEPQRDIAWSAVAKVAHDARLRSAPAPHDAFPQSADRRGGASVEDDQNEVFRRAPGGDVPAKRGAGWLGLFFLVMLVIVVGAGVYAASVFGYLDPRALPTPERYQPWLPALGAAAALLLVGVAAMAVISGAKRRKAATAPRAAPVEGDPLFVSYAHADNTAVLPVVEVVQAQGRNVWIDNQGIAGGDGWAGEIVRAIKGARGVIVMCSRHAFESDHVKREVYLADRYKKPMVPVFLEPASPPEDFEYFFAGVQWLELHKTPAADHAAAIARALKAV